MKPDRKIPLERLAAEWREHGALPDRDLWPDISAAIDEVEKVTAVPAPEPPVARRRRVLWPVAAVAATLFLLVFAGGEYQRDLTLVTGGADGEEAPGQLAVLDQALDELKDALAGNETDHGLVRLIRMVEQARGNLVRLNADGWQRGAPAGPLS